MIKSTLSEWRKNRFGILLILVGYMFGITILSFGASTIQAARQNQRDAVSGDDRHYGVVNISGAHLPNYQAVLNLLQNAAETAEVQIGFEGAEINGRSHFVVGVLYNENPEWQPPLLEGDHFSELQVNSSERNVLIGHHIKETFISKFASPPYELSVNGEPYHVIGVVGSENNSTQWDDTIYMPLKAFPKSLQAENQQFYSVFLRKNNQDPTADLNALAEAFREMDSTLNVNIEAPDQDNYDQSHIWNSVLLTGLLSGTILFVSCLNVVNLSLFWIVDRRKEFGLRKALGATDASIIALVMMEMLSIALIAAFLSLLIVYALKPLSHLTDFQYSISAANWIVSFAGALVCGLATSFVPIRAALKIEPIEVLKNS